MESTAPFPSVDWWYLQADFIFDRHEKPEQILKKIEQINTVQHVKIPKIFVKTDLIPITYDTLFQITKPFILITASNDDHSAPYMHYPPQDQEIETKTDLLLKHKALIKWFGKNITIKHPKLQPFFAGTKMAMENNPIFW